MKSLRGTLARLPLGTRPEGTGPGYCLLGSLAVVVADTLSTAGDPKVKAKKTSIGRGGREFRSTRTVDKALGGGNRERGTEWYGSCPCGQTGTKN